MRWFYFFFLSFLLFSCIEENPGQLIDVPPKPKNFVEDEKLIEIIADVHLAVAAFNSPGFIKDNNDSIKNEVYSVVFKKHSIDKFIYQENIVYREKFPEELAALFDQALVEVSKRQALLQSKEE